MRLETSSRSTGCPPLFYTVQSRPCSTRLPTSNLDHQFPTPPTNKSIALAKQTRTAMGSTAAIFVLLWCTVSALLNWTATAHQEIQTLSWHNKHLITLQPGGCSTFSLLHPSASQSKLLISLSKAQQDEASASCDLAQHIR